VLYVCALYSDVGDYCSNTAIGESVRYTAVIKNGALHEGGDQMTTGKELVRIFDMNLKRVGDSGWPAAGAIQAK
jgi:hypothetical protein